MKNINEMNVTELKALCFDLDQEIKLKQNQFSQVIRVLQDKLQEETKEVNKDGVTKKQNK
jgi:hypothetical protein